MTTAMPAYSLVAMIARYVDLVKPADVGGDPPVEIVFVGWHPPAAVRLVSLDYGKTIGWSGRGPVPTSAALLLAMDTSQDP